MNWTDVVLTPFNGEFVSFADGFFGFGRKVMKIWHRGVGKIKSDKRSDSRSSKAEVTTV